MLAQDRPTSRKLKSENRLYTFLTRSRSRSRSTNDHETHDMPPPQPNPASKPPTRVQSRPLSSTTTATNTTITPATPKPNKRPHTSAAPSSRKFSDLFALPLRRLSTSRSRSRSRPSTPHQDQDPPPLPTTSTIDDQATPTPRTPHARRISRPRSPSPTPTGPKVLRVTNATTTSSSTGSTAASIKITKFFSKGQPEQKKSIPISSVGPPVLPHIPISSSIKRVSSLHRRSTKDPASDLIQTAQLGSSPSLSKLVQNPEPSTSAHLHPTTTGRAAYHAMKGSLDSGFRYRPTAMGVVDEEGRTDFSSLQKGKARERDGHSTGAIPPVPIPRAPQIKMTNSARSTKHGSFDFERPGWGSSIIQRTGSNGTTATIQTIESGVSATFGRGRERESANGPGLAGVGTLQREASMKRLKEGEELSKAKLMAKSNGIRIQPKGEARTRPVTLHRTTDIDQHASTSNPNANGQVSSLGKATGRRLGHANTKAASGGGTTRLLGVKAHHGLFSFEPPVPSPTWSTGSVGPTAAAREVGSTWKDKTERELVRVQLEKERQRELQKSLRKSGKSGDRAAVPVPGLHPPTTNAGYRSGTKGRSLDLGLGLAWAPSKVREDALLPSSTFVRSLSNGSASRSASASTTRSAATNGNNGSSGHDGEENRTGSRSKGNEADVQMSKLGREVAEVFRNALDVDGYRAFKTYVHQFDAREIPFDGPTGIVSLVEKLLSSVSHLDDDKKRRLLDKFVRIILQQA